MNTDQEILKNLEKSGLDELDWSLNLNEFELSLIREIIPDGDIATVLEHHQSKSPENPTNFPSMDATATGGKDYRPPPSSLPEKRYRGVMPRRSGKFSAEIHSRNLENKGKRLWLGTYDTAEEAAMAFDRAAFKERGSHTVLNFPDLIGNLNVSPEKDTNKKLSLWSEGSPESSTNNHT